MVHRGNAGARGTAGSIGTKVAQRAAAFEMEIG